MSSVSLPSFSISLPILLAACVADRLEPEPVVDRTGHPAFESDAVRLLASRHGLELDRPDDPITITTGRMLHSTVAAGHDHVVVVLDDRLACADLNGTWDIWWASDLGTDREELVAGRLPDVLAEIRQARSRVRAADGWGMDTYLLRRAT